MACHRVRGDDSGLDRVFSRGSELLVSCPIFDASLLRCPVLISCMIQLAGLPFLSTDEHHRTGRIPSFVLLRHMPSLLTQRIAFAMQCPALTSVSAAAPAPGSQLARHAHHADADPFLHARWHSHARPQQATFPSPTSPALAPDVRRMLLPAKSVPSRKSWTAFRPTHTTRS